MDPVKTVVVTVVFSLVGLFFLYLVAAAIHDFAAPTLRRRKKARLRAKDPIAQMVDFKQARRRDEIRSWEEHWERIGGVCYSGYGVDTLGVEIPKRRATPTRVILPDGQIVELDQYQKYVQQAGW